MECLAGLCFLIVCHQDAEVLVVVEALHALKRFILKPINPFTAVLAALSLEKRPIEVPDLKSLSLFPLFASARERTSIKMHSTESRIVIGPSNVLFAGVSVYIFQAGKFTSWGS